MTSRAQRKMDPTQSDEQAIRSLVDTWLRASERGDLPTLLNLMEDDIVFMTPGREPFGKAEFVRGFEQMKGLKLEAASEIQEVRILGEWAWIHNFLRITITPERGSSNKRSGHILSILHKGADGEWRIARDSNLLMPEE
jgi:uncharacterized protein (TIGR02246 family)